MRRALLLGALVFVIALVARLLPFLYSGLPYNIDGFSIANIAERTQASGHLFPIPGDPNLPNYKVPLYALFVVVLSDLAGAAPLAIIQPAAPFVGAASVLALFALVRRVTRSDAAAGFAGLFLALDGTYVFSTATAIKASLAFALLPIVLHLYWHRQDPRKRGLAAILLLVLPWIHHLSALLTFLAVGLVLAVDLARWSSRGELRTRRVALEVALGPALFVPGLLHYHLVDLMYLRQVDDARQIVLFLSVLLLAVLLQLSLSRAARLGPWFLGRRRTGWRRLVDEKVLLPAGALALLLANHQASVFAGTIRTKPAVLWFVAPYLVLVAVGLIGFNVIRHTRNGFRPLATAMLLGPLAVMAFALLRGLDPLSFLVLYRSFPYLEVGIALCVGVGAAYVVARMRRPARKAAFAVAVTVLLVATLPLGYASADLYDVENATAAYEFRAMSHLHGLGDPYAGMDQRFHSTTSWYFFQRGDGGLPDAIARGGSLARYDVLLVQSSWTDRGAQRHPLPNLVLAPDALADALARHDVVYSVVSPIGDATIVRVR